MKIKNKNTKSFQKKENSKLKRRLLKLWSKAVKEKEDFTCIYCGSKRGEPNKSNPDSFIKIDAHHILQKEIANCPLKYDIRNSAVLCSSCHKFNGEHSAHKSPIVFYDWFRKKYPDRYDFILNNSNIRVDLDNRLILEEIEKKLTVNEPLDISRLKEIERQFPRTVKTRKPKNNPPDDLFSDDDVDDDEKSSSSSEST